MYEINILDLSTNKRWVETFDSYYLFRKKYMKLKHSKKLTMLSYSNLVD